MIHSKYYKKGEGYSGKKVLTIGSSYTGVELSAHLAKHAEVVHHCFRQPFWLLEHYVTVDKDRKVPFDFFEFVRLYY